MAQLELKTTVLNGEKFHLFDKQGDEIALPPEDKWNWTNPEWDTYCENLDKNLALDLKPGKYWLVESNHNVTTVYSLEADESAIRRDEVGGVANGIPEQAEEIGKVAVSTPRQVFDRFMQLGEIGA